MHMRIRPETKAIAAGLVAFTMAGTSVALASYLAPRVGNLSTAFLSIPAALLVLLPLYLRSRKKHAVHGNQTEASGGLRNGKPFLRAQFRCLLQALGGIVVFRLMTNLASHSTSVGVAGIVFATGPLVLAFGGALFYKDTLKPKDWLALALACGGLLLLQSDKGIAASAEGIVFLLLAVLGEAAMSLIRRKDGEAGLDSAANALYTVVWAIVLLSPFVAADWLVTGLPALGAGEFLLLLVYGVGSTAVGYLTWSYAAARLSSPVMGMCSVAAPLSALLFAVSAFGEVPGPVAVCGWGLALGGVLICVVGTSKPPENESGPAKSAAIEH